MAEADRVAMFKAGRTYENLRGKIERELLEYSSAERGPLPAKDKVEDMEIRLDNAERYYQKLAGLPGLVGSEQFPETLKEIKGLAAKIESAKERLENLRTAAKQTKKSPD